MAERKPPETSALLMGEMVNFQALETRTRTMLDAGMWVVDPATGKLTALGLRRWGKLSVDQKLGTDKPPFAIVAPDPEKKRLFFIPSNKPSVNTVEVRYHRTGAVMNLVPVFTYLDRTLEPGSREFFPIEITERPVQVGDVTEFALEMPLKRITTRHEKKESKEKRKAAARKARAAKEAAAPAAQPPEQPK